jgi:UPF0271 protein
MTELPAADGPPNCRPIDLNADVGESFGVYRHGCDARLFLHITSANIACGWHAGDPMIMRNTVELACQHGVAVGAHPGYPDLLGFGRRGMAVSPGEAKQYVIYQIGALSAFAKAARLPLQHVKLHGALYHDAMHNRALANAIVEGLCEVQPDVIVLAQPGSTVLEAAFQAGLKVAREAFADRAYLADGTLVPRSLPGAIISDPQAAADRAVEFAASGSIRTITGERIDVAADSICVHGDNPEALALVVHIRRALTEAGVPIRPLSEFLRG